MLKRVRLGLSTRELVIFSILASLMFITTAFIKIIPSVHLLALFIGASTLVYRVRALFPLYTYIILDFAFHGFTLSWLPHLYLWLPLWFSFMLVGKMNIPRKVQMPLYMFICGLLGLSFGAMYAPAQALMYGLNFEATITWIVIGLPFDIIHAISNIVAATMIIPLASLIEKFKKNQIAIL